ncbi:transmembrane protein 132C [Phycodurus eques]|uniref:transmembrane protein 132C n=1 Tax=Phycodurus eques TaxID=693459 RepID=UPI002ACE8956|nr:transmembrane protein 132C [Phycodurus eques]
MEPTRARGVRGPGGRARYWSTLLLVLWEVCAGHAGSSSPGQVAPDLTQPRFATSLPTYLPVQCQLSGADSAFFLRDANQDGIRNGSLASRTEHFVLHHLESGVAVPQTLPAVVCSYGNLSTERQIPVELLQGPPPSLQPTASHVTLKWKVKGHVVVPKVGATQPWIQVLFYLVGRRWDESDPPPPHLLPCVRALAVRDPSEAAPSAGCRLVGPSGICVVRLEIPPAWFVPLQAKRRPAEGALPSLDVYYSIIPVEGAGLECPSIVNEPWKSLNVNSGPLGGLGINPWSPLIEGGLQDMQKAGLVAMSVAPVAPKGEILTLDHNLDVLVPPSPVRLGKTVAFTVYMKTTSHDEQFILRVWFQSGISFVAVKPSDLVAWEIKQEMAPSGGSLAVMCQRKILSTATARLESPSYEVMQLDFEVDNVITLAPTQTLHWSVEYASGAPSSAERVSHLYVSNADIQGIVPLAQDTEVLNTAILTGHRVSLPVKLVTVGTDGQVREVDDSVSCSSADVDVLKVSSNCDEVLVNGKEMRGHHRVTVAFAYMHLTASLPLTVWVPKLPLQIHVSDTELSQVKGWRVPIAPNTAANANNRRPTRDSEDDEDDERKGKGCTLQYQYALVRVLTHFVAEPSDPGGEVVHMLGADWQADITHLVLDQLKVEDERIARLVDRRVLIGRDLGITTIQVLSPLSDSILAEKTVTVLDDKVTIADMGVQLVASLSLTMAAAGGNYQAIQLTATASDLMHAPKQEAAISAWIHYSDGCITPLDIYDPKDFLLSAVSLDDTVISITNEEQHWPVVVAEGEGQGALVRVEMVISETCQKSKRKSVLASGVGKVAVKFGDGRGGDGGGVPEEGDRPDNGTEQLRAGEEAEWKSKSVVVSEDLEEGAMRKVILTTKSTVTHRASSVKAGSGSGVGGKGTSQTGDYAGYPAQVEVPGPLDSELTQTTRGLSDLEIGMYALLGVFCLAILVFLINCVSFAFRYRHKQVPVLETGGNMNHAHDWVWLGNDADLLADHPDHPDPCPGVLPDECTTIIDRGEDTYEENKYLLNGAGTALAVAANRGGGGHRGVSHSQTLPRSLPDSHQCLSTITAARHDTEHLNNSPRASAKRKRVKFTSFATVLPNDHHQGGARGSSPYANPSVLLGKGGEDDIKWVCHDVDMSQSEMRSYMERLQDSL